MLSTSCLFLQALWGCFRALFGVYEEQLSIFVFTKLIFFVKMKKKVVGSAQKSRVGRGAPNTAIIFFGLIIIIIIIIIFYVIDIQSVTIFKIQQF